MCGRYNILTSAQAIVDYFEVAEVLFDPDQWTPRCNVAPSQQVPVVRSRSASVRELALLRWGLLPHWAKEEKTRYRTINARAESVASKPAYRSAFRVRRCLVPATGFFEWQQTAAGKQPWNFRLKNKQPFAFAGLWEHWEGTEGKVIESFTIIVTDANELVRPVHDRMPAILSPGEYAAWLDPTHADTAALLAMLDPYPAEPMEGYPVSRRVNNPANDDAACVSPARTI